MQKARLYCVFDKKAETFFPPFLQPNDACGDRRFVELLADPSMVVSKHPEDYALYCVGTFDEYTGTIDPLVGERMVLVNPGLMPGRPQEVAMAEEEAMRKFSTWVASRGLELGKDGQVRALDRGAI